MLLECSVLLVSLISPTPGHQSFGLFAESPHAFHAGCGYTEACWEAWCREVVRRKQSNEPVDDGSTVIGKFDIRELCCISAFSDCLQQCLVLCLTNAAVSEHSAITTVTACTPAFATHVCAEDAATQSAPQALPAHFLEMCSELAGVQVVQKPAAAPRIPCPPLQEQEGRDTGTDIGYDGVNCWEDVQGRYGALSRAVTLCSMMLMTDVVHVG